jgi:drug/metabolite transporter (DMT)-like permease
MSPAVQGALWIVVSAVAWSVMVGIARGLSKDIHTFEIVFFRSFFSLLFFLPWIMRVGRTGLRTDRPLAHLSRGLTGLAALYLLFGALYFTPMAEVAAITFTRPVFASIGAILFLREVASGRRWTACIVGLAGTLIIIRPGLVALDIGQLLAVGCVVAMTVTSLTVKSLTRTEGADTIAFYQMVVFSSISLVPMLFVWTVPDWRSLGLLVLMGAAGNLSQRTMTRAYVVADATVILPFEYTRLPISALLGLILFGEFPDIWTWIGGSVIFLATWAMARGESRARAAVRS